MSGFLKFLSLCLSCFWVCFLTEAGSSLLWGGQREAGLVAQMSAADQWVLGQRAVFSPEELQRLEDLTSPEALESEVRFLVENGGLYPGSVMPDAQGMRPVHRYILDRLTPLKDYGLQILGVLKSEVLVPVAARAEGSFLEVEGRRFPVKAFWPNGAQPSLTPAEGIRGPLIDAGSGRLADFDGLEVNGAVVLMDFGAGRNWETAFSLGARAVIAVEDAFMIRSNAERWFANTPVPLARFYVDRKVGAQLRSLAVDSAGSRQGKIPRQVLLRGGHVWERRPVQSIFAYLPPREPIRYTVVENDLLTRIGLEVNLDVRELARYNGLEPGQVPAVGTELRLPGQRRTIPIREHELNRRIAAQFGISLEALLEANPGLTSYPEVQTQIIIPNLPDPIVLACAIDSVSSVPESPHGAMVAANLALQLRLVEHLATHPSAVRRKGLLVAFLDGEHFSGTASRTLAEFVERQAGRFQSRFTEDLSEVVKKYQAAYEALSRGEFTQLSDSHARWLTEGFLTSEFERGRIQLAEERVRILLQLEGGALDSDSRLPDDSPLRPGLQSRLRILEASRDEFLAIRRRSFDNSMIPWQERLERMWTALRDPAHQKTFEHLNVSADEMVRRLELQKKEQEARLLVAETNQETVRHILRRLGGVQACLGWFLRLSDGSHSVSVGTAGGPQFRGAIGLPGQFAAKVSERLTDQIAFAAVQAGWPQEFLVVGPRDRSVFALMNLPEVPLFGEFWTTLGVGLLNFRTANDTLPRLDTPHDIPEFFRFKAFAVQARTVATALRLGLESPLDSLPPSQVKRPSFSRLVGSTVEFNIRSGIDPREPVPGLVVQFPSLRRAENQAFNTATHLGVRRSVMVQSDLSGGFALPFESISFVTANPPTIYAFGINLETGLIDRVVNQGQVGTGVRTANFYLLDGIESEKTLVVSRGYPLVFFPGADPMAYETVGVNQQVTVLDAVRNGPPRDFALINPLSMFRENDLDSNILLLPPDRRAILIMRNNLIFSLLLVGEITPERPKGEGLVIGPSEDGDPRIALTLTPREVARSMHTLALMRLNQYREFGIIDQRLDAAVQRAGEKLAEAHEAVERKDWESANGLAREAWGMLVRAYPGILALGREAVFSVIVLMAFLVPASWFLERLFIGAKTIVVQLIAVSLIFTAGTLFLNWNHPAFQISVSPFIVMISFIMILMSLVVLVICYQRFEVILRRARSSAGEVESEEISLFASLGTALSLGISNLKKRISRTVLTTLTVSVLTFSIIAFVSVKGSNTLARRMVALDADVGGRLVEPLPPAYEGVLFRNFFWTALPSPFVQAIRSEFSARHRVAVRSWFIEKEGGNNADREGINQVEVRSVQSKNSSIVTGVMAFEPVETELSGLHRAVSRMEWFREADRRTGDPGDLFSIILPSRVAEELGIDEAMIFDEKGRLPREQLPKVKMLNHEWAVVGILDTAHADRIRDVNGKSLAMLDYLRSSASSSAAQGDLIDEPPSYHLSWDDLVIVPEAAAAFVGAKPRSLAVKISSEEMPTFARDAALRINRPMFAYTDGQLVLLTSKQEVSIGGMAKIIVPVILCILIVSNTMLGAVEERKGEVSMLGAIGLSPRQISFLLLSESAVFSVLGIVFGMFAGLLFANLVPWIAEMTGGFLGGLTFNFTSMISTLLAIGTGLVVVVATLIPASKAAALAAPSGMNKWELPAPDGEGKILFLLPFTLTGGNAVGMLAFFRRFLLNHTEATSQDFNCRHVEFHLKKNPDGLALTADMWLSPYDLDVAQHMVMMISPTESAGVFQVHIRLDRFSGTEEAWLRTNYGFLDLVRLQFLLWRNLSQEQRDAFIAEGAAMLQDEMSKA